VSDTNSRLEQFKKMAEADPNNELGHFSLGRAYLDAGMEADAIASLTRTLELNPNISKAYQLLAQAQLQSGQQKEAIATLTKGADIANSRGDLMPRNEMTRMLGELGAPVPAYEKAQPEQAVGEGQILCKRCGRVMPKMASAPFRNEQGKLIHENICAECWREWIPTGTKVINELRLPLNDPQASKVYDQHMLEFLNLSK
jgi:Fe-S cluster biosynthesis and repair protein YggX